MKDHPRDMLAASVQLDLVRLDRSQGKADAAVTELKRLIAEPEHAAPLDTLLYELAKTLEQQGKAEEARQAWQRIADEFPRSPYFAEAQKSSATASVARNL